MSNVGSSRSNMGVFTGQTWLCLQSQTCCIHGPHQPTHIFTFNRGVVVQKCQTLPLSVFMRCPLSVALHYVTSYTVGLGLVQRYIYNVLIFFRGELGSKAIPQVL